MLSRASIARQPWPVELIVLNANCWSLGAASGGSAIPKAFVTPAAADAAADAAAEGGAADAADDAAADGFGDSAGAQASRTAGAAISPPTTTADRPMNER